MTKALPIALALATALVGGRPSGAGETRVGTDGAEAGRAVADAPQAGRAGSWAGLADRTVFEAANVSPQRTIDNLRAFARLYGYIRFFHPSDEAAGIDWDRFAIHGVGRVKDAATHRDLQDRLEALFEPIAPTLAIHEAGGSETSTPHSLAPVPEDTAGLETVAWQHQGVLVNPARPNIYWSRRTSREAQMAVPNLGYATLAQAIDAEDHRGRRIRLRARVRTAVRGAGNQARLWLRVERPDGQVGFFDNMFDRPITTAEWRSYEIAGRVAEDAERIVFGAVADGFGEFGFDAFELAVAGNDGRWTAVEIADPGFERGPEALGRDDEGSPFEPSVVDRWVGRSRGYEYQASEVGPAEGSRAAVIRTMRRTLSTPLFEEEPAPGEVVERPLGAGLTARFPVSLFSDAEGTLPRAESARVARLEGALREIDLARATADEEDVRSADVVIAWNVLQHFYPYFDVVDVDWEAELDRALERALADRTGPEFQETLRLMVARLGDGHGRVVHPWYGPNGELPWRVEWIEDHAVVTVPDDPAFRRGDIVLAVDGVPASELIAREMRLVSGSEGWRRYRATRTLGAGARGSEASVRLEREGRELEVTVVREASRAVPEFDRPQVTELEPGIWYVDLDRAPWAAIDSVVLELAAADGVIFDLRGYPAGNHAILRHLLPVPDTSTAWMRTPRILYPDQERVVGYRSAGWSLQPAEPHIDGNVAFITDGRAISYAESVLGFVEHYGLGEIVGQPTAGANGNVNSFVLPGGFTVAWTGMRVVKHDASQHHLVGVRPTVPASRTIRGVREGRDELLEVALQAVRPEHPS